MPRPRFLSLAPAQRDAILDAAFAEFTEHGFNAASLNRIIASAGISKGSMYYYFDDKADLYSETVRVALSRLVEGLELPALDSGAPDEFWAEIEALAVRFASRLVTSPATVALVREVLRESGGPAQAASASQSAATPWLEQTLTTGQQLGAVRTDLPTPLLVATALALGQAMDTWLFDPAGTTRVVEAVPPLIALMRDALDPTPPRRPRSTSPG